MAKTIKKGVINSTDGMNWDIITYHTFLGWIQLRKSLPDAPFHYVNMSKYLMKMFVFKCIEMKMEPEEIRRVCDISDRVLKAFVTRIHGI